MYILSFLIISSVLVNFCCLRQKNLKRTYVPGKIIKSCKFMITLIEMSIIILEYMVNMQKIIAKKSGDVQHTLKVISHSLHFYYAFHYYIIFAVARILKIGNIFIWLFLPLKPILCSASKILKVNVFPIKPKSKLL